MFTLSSHVLCSYRWGETVLNAIGKLQNMCYKNSGGESISNFRTERKYRL